MKIFSIQEPLDNQCKDTDDDGRYPKRDGNWRTAVAHIITAVIGSGVLSLGWAVAQTGWVFGPLILFLFALVTLYTATLLCDAYRSGDEFTGTRNQTYRKAVRAQLGPYQECLCALVQYVQLFTSGVGYTVTGSLSLVAAKRAICFSHYPDRLAAPCSFSNIPWMVFFGALNVIFSQIPDFGNLWWLSYLAAAMSFAYAFIGMGLAIGKTAERGHPDYGTALGNAHKLDSSQAVWNIFTAFGSMAFAYSYNLVLIEIQDTLKQPPSEAQSMKKATRFGIVCTTLFYMAVACLSYSGFGDASPGNLLTGFGFFDPYWLVSAANVFVFVHLIGGYQVFMQPFMDFVEDVIKRRLPHWRFLHVEKVFYLPAFGRIPLNSLKLVSRTTLVCITTIIALVLPFFNAIVGLLGAISFFPLTVYFPIQMYLSRENIPRFSFKWWLNNLLCTLALCISLMAGIGAVVSIINELKVYKPFKSTSHVVSTP